MPIDHSNLRVLIVDNDKYMRLLIKQVLEELGFQTENIYQSTDGQGALDLLSSKNADFVICDWRMEPMDGVTFLRKLRNPKDSPAPGISVILCSSDLDKKLVEEFRDAGVNEVMVKPITVGAMQSRIRAILESPRPIIKLTEYIGPDRRRVDDGDKPRERRASKSEKRGRPE